MSVAQKPPNGTTHYVHPDDFLVEAEPPTAEPPTHAEEHEADQKTLAARRWISDVLAASAAVMAYLREVHGEELARLYGQEQAEEIWRNAAAAYRALIDAARRADDGRSRLRRFSLPSWAAEAYRRRVLIPRGLTEQDERRIKGTLARAWRRDGWADVHRLQRVTQLALFERAAPEFKANRERKAADYIDHLTDLLAQVMRLAKQQGRRYGVPRFRLAARKYVEEFRASHQPYAPDWKPTGPAGEQKVSQPRGEEAPATERLEQLAVRAGRSCGALAAGLPEEEIDAAGMLLLERLAAEWEKATGHALPLRRVLTMADSSENDPAAADSSADADRAFSPDETDDFPAKTDESAGAPADIQSAEGVPAYEVREHDPEPEPRGVSRDEAEAAARAFASVGVGRLKVVFVDDTKGRNDPANCVCAEEVTVPEFVERLPLYLERTDQAPAVSMTVRAHFKGETRLLQLDDCPAEVLALVEPFTFIHFATSPGSAQAWIALADDLTPEQYDGLRRRLLKRLEPTGANGGAYGALRWPGSLNRKPKRRYPDGESPRVQLLRAAYGRRASAAEQEAAGLLAPPRPKPSSEAARAIRGRFPGADEWPDMAQYLVETGGDRSRAESKWAVRALSLGHPRAAVEAELIRIGGKAGARRRDNYVRETVEKAARWLTGHGQPRAAGM